MSKLNSPTPAENYALMFGDDGLLHLIDCVDGDKTGLNAVGLAVINAGFSGLRAIPTNGNSILWQIQPNTLDGRFFALVCYHAMHGYPLPTPEQALKILHALLKTNKGGCNE